MSDARTANTGQPVTYHETEPVHRQDLVAAVLEVLRSPEGRAAIAEATRNPLVGKRCRVPPPFDKVARVAAVEPSGMLRVRCDEWDMGMVDFRVRPEQVEWIDPSAGGPDGRSVLAEVFPGLIPHAFVVGDPRHDSCAVCGKGSRNTVHVSPAMP